MTYKDSTVYMPGELKERYIAAAREAGFEVKQGRSSQTPHFLKYLLENRGWEQVDLSAKSAEAVWKKFQKSISPILAQLIIELGKHGEKIDLCLDSKFGYLWVSQYAHTQSGSSFNDLISAEVNLSGLELFAFGTIVKEILEALPPHNRSEVGKDAVILDFLYEAMDGVKAKSSPKTILDVIPNKTARLQPLPGLSLSRLTEDILARITKDDLAKNPSRYEMLMRLALDLDPNCTLAYCYLGYLEEAKGRINSALDFFQQALQCAENNLEQERLESDRTLCQWNGVSQVYIQARTDLALAYWKLGDFSSAIGHFQELLTKYVDEDSEVRDYLLCCLLESASKEPTALNKLGVVLKEYYPKEPETAWNYTYACSLFAQFGENRKANDALRVAFKCNKYVPMFLLMDLDEFATWSADTTYDGPEEAKQTAIQYYKLAVRGWTKIDGALDWLVERAFKASILDEYRPEFTSQNRPKHNEKVIMGYGPIIDEVAEPEDHRSTAASQPDSWEFSTPSNSRSSKSEKTPNDSEFIRQRQAPDIEIDQQLITQWKIAMLNEFGFSGDTTRPKVEPFVCCRRLHLMDREGQYILTLMPDNIGAEQVAFALNALVEQKNVKMPAQIFVLEDDQVVGHTIIDSESGKNNLA